MIPYVIFFTHFIFLNSGFLILEVKVVLPNFQNTVL